MAILQLLTIPMLWRILWIIYSTEVWGGGGRWYANGLKVMATTELVSGQFSYFAHHPTSTFHM